ncbi:hypothetical protein SLEP1_g43099 [Rubroshorea leprosula]|uniref:Uncharacterized protein n=1 Tax=Rubroshorea leprosula TaxID=152421 RepID=A0AAV5LCC1_9ROSI|nr:hypothetical protein SLEP1_g43099 [Rubroshorea leprosula]
MVFSPLNRKSYLHSCSNSLPSSPYLLIPQIDEHLARLISSSEATTSSSSQISKNLSGLRDVYELVNSLLQLPHVEQALSHQCQDDEVLGGSLRLLDACGMAKDALLQAKANTQELQSTLRRRWGNEVKFIHEVKEYLASRKDAKKSINKFMRNFINL